MQSVVYCWRRHQISWFIFLFYSCFCFLPSLKHTSGSASDWKLWTVQLIATSILAWTLQDFDSCAGNENSAESHVLQSPPAPCIMHCTGEKFILWHFLQITSHFLLFYLSMWSCFVSLWAGGGIDFLKDGYGSERLMIFWSSKAIFFMACAINMTFDLLQHAGWKNPYTYFNHNINSCAISLRGKKMSFCSFVIENHNKIYGSVNCTESHERFIFIHHASSQRTLRTFPEYDSLMPSKGSTMHSATSWANPHLN